MARNRRNIAVATLAALALLIVPATVQADYGVVPVVPAYGTELARLQAAHVATVRLGIGIGGVEAAGWTGFDRQYAAFASHGMNPIVQLHADPPMNRAKWSEFVTEAAKRYNPRAFEISNEPNVTGWTGRAYAGLVNVAGAAIHAVRPSEVVLAGSLAPAWGHGIKPTRFLDDFYSVANRSAFDGLSVHPYPSMRDRYTTKAPGIVVALTQAWRQVAVDHGDNVPVWITEIGYSSGSKVTQQWLLAATFADLAQHRASLHLRDVVWYMDRDGVYPWPGTGLWRRDLTPKPAWDVFRRFSLGLTVNPATVNPSTTTGSGTTGTGTTSAQGGRIKGRVRHTHHRRLRVTVIQHHHHVAKARLHHGAFRVHNLDPGRYHVKVRHCHRVRAKVRAGHVTKVRPRLRRS